jgi:hypothetical protein
MNGSCTMKLADGSQCSLPACHHWGPVLFCCDHFDNFVYELLHLKTQVEKRKHIDILEEYDRQTSQSSLIAGTHCKADDKSESS